MATAVLTPAATISTDAQVSPGLATFGKRIVNAIYESRMKTAQRELHRREALLADLGRKQDHSSDFLNQRDFLPFKI